MLAIGLAGCGSGTPSPRQTLPAADVARWLDEVQAIEVRTPDGAVLSRITDRRTMHTFFSLLPKSEFDDVFNSAGRTRYLVHFVGPRYSDDYIWFTDTHVRYVPKGAAKLTPGERTTILAALGVRPD